MQGIRSIQQGLDEQQQRIDNPRPQSREVFPKDGDQVFISSLATGHDDDNKLAQIQLYTFRGPNGWTNLMKHKDVDESGLPEEARLQRKFAFWAYVHEITHAFNPNNLDWEVIEGAMGRKVFKETINDFKLISLGFGRGNYLWNQLTDVYGEWGSLDKGVIRIKRSGQELATTYQITGTTRSDGIPKAKMDEVKDLPGVEEYYLDRYGKMPEQSELNINAGEDGKQF
tara:strand:+ start:294 stop:974 length:681 start_codon:yes stop_codon:yes gene_type:complete